MSKKELIQIRVSEDEKLKIKTIARKKGMTISEFILYSLMRTISEYEIYELIKNESYML
ncbi:plasmid mobilization protein [Clostridium tertium]|jgi:antitoxin component of RelBE/YafQ-DinJ toxin-antitoxin module|uniref:plasmid mobilization protein n=1 Tax=Clostridium tertium TaxID=1559 RepID=UPI003564A043